jgi:septal ring factor EnvC (AmiA/AmiB activator)
MEPITLNSLWVIIGIIVASGGVVFTAFGLVNALKDRISKVEGKFYTLENAVRNTTHQTAELISSVKDIQESVADIKITQTEMRVVLSGTDGHNGLRAELREVKSELRELVNKM